MNDELAWSMGHREVSCPKKTEIPACGRQVRFRIFSSEGIPSEEDPRNGKSIEDARHFGMSSECLPREMRRRSIFHCG